MLVHILTLCVCTFGRRVRMELENANACSLVFFVRMFLVVRSGLGDQGWSLSSCVELAICVCNFVSDL